MRNRIEGLSTALPIPANGVIPEGYYVVPNTQTMQVVPYGYRVINADASGNGVLAAISAGALTAELAQSESPTPTLDASMNAVLRYNPLDANVQYHDSVKDITAQAQGEKTTGTWVVDQSGNKRYYEFGQVATDATYYAPGAYAYGAATYVPNYEDSVYLSRVTGQSQVGRVYDYATQKLGFCAKNAASPDALEQSCLALDANTCASTSCCVLLGGSKCVSGSATGPAMPGNYADPYVANRDFYVYNGTCYGNC
jgi:hypothetical protein